MDTFDPSSIKNIYKPAPNSHKGQNGQVTIIGGSKLFHGAPLFALTVASKIVDMVFFASPEPSIGEVAMQIKSKLFSFIWIPWDDLEKYIKKSDCILIGPGFMRYASEKDANRTLPKRNDESYLETREITRYLLSKFKNKKWVIDAGSLQVMEPEWIPENAILTPNSKEYEMLFKSKIIMINDELSPETIENAQKNTRKHKCVIVLKGHHAIVVSSDKICEIPGGNPGLTKGGSGDVEAGLTAALLAKNEPFWSASAASFIAKKAADELYGEVGPYYSSDDLAKRVAKVIFELTK